MGIRNWQPVVRDQKEQRTELAAKVHNGLQCLRRRRRRRRRSDPNSTFLGYVTLCRPANIYRRLGETCDLNLLNGRRQKKGASETSVNFYHNTLLHTPEDITVHSHCHGNFKSGNTYFLKTLLSHDVTISQHYSDYRSFPLTQFTL